MIRLPKFVLVYMLFALTLAAETPTQSSSRSTKSPPIAPIPKAVTWTVTFSYPEETKNDGSSNKNDVKGRVRTITFIRLLEITHIQTTTTQGETVDTWIVGDEHYGKSRGSSEWAMEGKTIENSMQGFPGVEWIRPDQYVRNINYLDMDCLLYMPQQPPAAVELGDSKKLLEFLGKAPCLAIIDAKTNLPVEIRIGGVKEVFEFKAPPKSLTLPVDLASEIEQGKRVRALINARPPRPY